MKLSCSPFFFALLVALATLAHSPALLAQQVHLPIVGRQFITIGFEAQGGPILDWSGDDLGLSSTLGPRARIGLHHVVSPNLSMNLEFSPGGTYFSPHSIGPDGLADSQIRFDWRLSILGRRFAIGPDSGWTLAGGIDYRQAHLREGRLLQFGPTLRVGRYLWITDERFLLFELGAHYGIFEGLNITSFSEEGPVSVPTDWTLPSLSLGVQWAF